MRTRLVLAGRVRAGLRTPIACTLLLPRGRSGSLSGRARAIIERGRADLRSHSGRGSRCCMQRYARGFASLRHLYGFLPHQRAEGAIVQQIIARNGVGETRDEVVYSERELRFSGETSVCLRAYIRRACGICSDGLGASLGVSAQHCAVRSFEFEFPEERLHALLERRIVVNRFGYMRAPNFLFYLSAERSQQKLTQVVHWARAHA